jgi:hypothetical protein
LATGTGGLVRQHCAEVEKASEMQGTALDSRLDSKSWVGHLGALRNNIYKERQGGCGLLCYGVMLDGVVHTLQTEPDWEANKCMQLEFVYN